MLLLPSLHLSSLSTVPSQGSQSLLQSRIMLLLPSPAMAPLTPSLILHTRGRPRQRCPSLKLWSPTPTPPPSPHMPSQPSSSTRETATTPSTSLPRPLQPQCPLPRPSLCTPPPPRPQSTSPQPPRSRCISLLHPPSQLTSLHRPPPSQPTSPQPHRSPLMLLQSPPMPQLGPSTNPSPATSLLPSRLTMLLPPLRPQLLGPLTMSPSRRLTSSTQVTPPSTFTSNPRCWSRCMRPRSTGLRHPPSLPISLQPPASQLQSTNPSPQCLSISRSLQSKLTTHLPASLLTSQCQSLNTVLPSPPMVLVLNLMSLSLLRSILRLTSLSPPSLHTSLLPQLSQLISLLPQLSQLISLLP